MLFNPDNPISPAVLETMGLAAKLLGVELQQFGTRRQEEFADAFSAMAMRRVEAVVVVDDAMIGSNSGPIVELAIAQRLGSIGSLDSF